jgi:hypothetical protein
MRTPLVIDGRNHLDAAAMRAAGYAYEGMGRAASPFAALPRRRARVEAARAVVEAIVLAGREGRAHGRRRRRAAEVARRCGRQAACSPTRLDVSRPPGSDA